MSGYIEDMLLRDFLALAQNGVEEAGAALLSREALNAAMAGLTKGPQAAPETVPARGVRPVGEAMARAEMPEESASTVVATGETVTRPSEIFGQVQAQTTQGASSSGLARLFDTLTQVSTVQSAITAQDQTGGGPGGGVLNMVRDVFTSVLKGGLGLSPLLGTIFGLFGAGNEEPAASPLVKYALPAALHFQTAANSDGTSGVDYDQYGRPRAIRAVESGNAGPATGAAVTVNVQAMDARSFLDHSTEIAAAVREAMLNLNSINDVVADL